MKIKELINEATSFKEGDTEGKYDIEVFDKEKFAELIVFECIKLAVFKGDATTGKAIKEHFGVEE